MCRFLVYRGREMLMADLLTRSAKSLIHQSYRAREREEPLNGDGFGVGWYAEDDPVPCVITAITPAWSNRNLHNLAEKIRAGAFFAHVRAATPGLAVSDLNCHPFRHERFMWMHNGRIAQFGRVKRRLRGLLSDDSYAFIQGTTDSEHAFALFLDKLTALGSHGIAAYEEAMSATVRQLEQLTREAGIGEPSRYNFAFTDGVDVVATRYCDIEGQRPETLYVAQGERFACRDGEYRMYPAAGPPDAVIVASEPLTDDAADWQAVPANHMVSVDVALEVRVTAL